MKNKIGKKLVKSNNECGFDQILKSASFRESFSSRKKHTKKVIIPDRVTGWEVGEENTQTQRCIEFGCMCWCLNIRNTKVTMIKMGTKRCIRILTRNKIARKIFPRLTFRKRSSDR